MINKIDLSNKADTLRKKLGEDKESAIDIFKVAVQKIDNLTLVFSPLGKNISGVCYKGNKSNLISINSQMSVGRQRFSLAHELYHLYFDELSKKSISLVSYEQDKDENEKKADQFASYFLMPSSSLYTMISDIKEKNNKKMLTLEDVIKIGQYYGVSHKAMLYRLLDDGYIQKEQIKDLEVKVIETAKKLGYDTALYEHAPVTKDRTTFGHYIKTSEKLKNLEKISEGKYEELLLTAFRHDIVYGSNEEEEFSFD